MNRALKEGMPAALNVKQAVPFFAVTDMQASLRYYVEGLGFRMTSKWVDEGVLRWCWLQLGNASLMLQEYRRHGHDSWIPTCKVGEGVTICFICEDALTLYHSYAAKGIEVSRPFVGNKMWVTSLTDPDGYKLIFESPTDAPEDTHYSEELVEAK